MYISADESETTKQKFFDNLLASKQQSTKTKGNMSLLSAICELCPHLANQRPYVGSGNISLTVTVGDMSKEEMNSVLKVHCSQMGGYEDGVNFLVPFFDRLKPSPEKGTVKLARMTADLGAANSWPDYCGHEINHVARQKGLDFCSPEIVCKIFQAWLQTPRARDHFYVSCGDIYCFFTDYGGEHRQILICNDYSDIPFGEDVIYVDSREQERQ